MSQTLPWAIGVDLGGTKIKTAGIDAAGSIKHVVLYATDVAGGVSTIRRQIVEAVEKIRCNVKHPPAGVCVGIPGQVDEDAGVVHFAPNLDWHDVPFAAELSSHLGLSVTVINDVRAATWGEWIYGAGKSCRDLVCLFVGTGIGGGVVSGGRMISGAGNSAGELGHVTIALDGPPCHCPNTGCLEAFAGGWAIARRARAAVLNDPAAGAFLREQAGGMLDAITAQTVCQAALAGNDLARRLMDDITAALIAGAVSIVNAFNPERLILGGGVMNGMPELVKRIAGGVHRRALAAATKGLQVLSSKLHGDAGIVGAAALILHETERMRNREITDLTSSSPTE